MKPNVILTIGVIVIFLMGSFTGCLIQKNFIAEPCIELVKTDTVRVVMYDSATVTATVKSKPRKVRKFHFQENGKLDTIHCDTLRLITRELITLADTSFYSDTIRNDKSHNIVINDTIVGHRLGLGVEFKNLRPLVRETVTNTVVKKKQWQIYSSIQVPTNGKTATVILSALVTTPFGLAVGIGGDPVRREVVPQLGWVIKFQQK